MPLTPLHLGAGLFLANLSKKLNLWGLLFGSFVMDLEPLILIIGKKCYNCYHHGFFHSILGAIFSSLILAWILWGFREKLNKISLKLRLVQSFSFGTLYLSSILAWLTHIFLDNITHFDVFPFWPSHYKPFYIGKEAYWPSNLILLILGIFGLILIYRNYKKNKIHYQKYVRH